MKNFGRKKIIIGCLIVAGVVLAGALATNPIKTFINNKNALESNQYTILKKGKSINYIEAKGKIDSLNDSFGVYADSNNQMYKIEKVNVQVGDKVNKGDVIAVLDSSDLQSQINEAREKLNTTKANTSINLRVKEEAYNNLVSKNENNINKSIIEGEKNLNTAKMDMDEKNRVYEQNLILAQNDSITNEQLIQSKNALDNAKIAYDSAVSALESIKKDNETALIQAKNELDSAKAANNDKSGELGISLKEKQLEGCNVRACASGTIINSNAKEGTPAGAVQLFEIKDLDNLIVKADVKENDISKIKIGQKAEIKVDAAENDILEGTVISIDPAAENKAENPLELEDDNDDAEFTVKIQFDKSDERIMDGMNADVNIILNQKEDTYKVPCNCIIKDGDDYYVYVAENKEDKYTIKKVNVTKGIESDTEIEIIGQDIMDDLIILNTPTDYYEGQEIHIMKKY